MKNKFIYLPIRKITLNINKIMYVKEDGYVQMVNKKFFDLSSRDLEVLKSFIQKQDA